MKSFENGKEAAFWIEEGPKTVTTPDTISRAKAFNEPRYVVGISERDAIVINSALNFFQQAIQSHRSQLAEEQTDYQNRPPETAHIHLSDHAGQLINDLGDIAGLSYGDQATIDAYTEFFPPRAHAMLEGSKQIAVPQTTE